MEHILESYGYPLVFLGTLFEGETPLLLGGFLAHRGYFSGPLLVLVGFAGTYCGDQFFFFLGRTRGQALIARHPVWQRRTQRIQGYLSRHENWVVLGFRFLYGFRTVTPILIGTTSIPPVKFLLLNAVGGLVWATVIVSLGYVFGDVMELLVRDVERIEGLVIGVVLAGAATVWLFRAIRERKSRTGESAPRALRPQDRPPTG